MPRKDEAMAAMRDALRIQDPEWDISPGTPEWSILEAAAQQIENITFNGVLDDYHFDIDKKSGIELDIIMAMFGFARVKGRRATGSVTFSRGTAATTDYIIPIGTQVFVPSTAFSAAIYFATTSSAVLAQGETSVSVPVQAIVAGTSGNVAAGAVSGMSTSVGGVTAVTNPDAITGGRDQESDQDLRDRWRRTVFRNISGTEDAFIGIAFNESAFVTRANILGPVERYLEQIQLIEPEDLTTATPWEGVLNGNITSGQTTLTLQSGQGPRFPVALVNENADDFYVGIYSNTTCTEIALCTRKDEGTDVLYITRPTGSVAHLSGDTVRVVYPSSVTDSKFTYPAGGEIIGLNVGQTTQQIGRRDVDYELITDNTVPSSAPFPALYVTVTGAGTFGLDTVIDMETEYTPNASRNDPGASIAEKADLFADGVDPLTVTEQVPMRIDRVFGTNVTETDYLRDDGINTPAIGNYFTQLSKAPIADFPTSISVQAFGTTDATTYYKDEDYWLATDKTVYEGSPRSSNGIEWNTPLDAPNATNDDFAVTIQAVNGKLSGFLSYVMTYEIDGVESLPLATPIHAASVNATSGDGKNAITLDLYDQAQYGVGAVVWRKIYRSASSASFAASQLGPFYLLAVVKNNVTTAYLDNKPDGALDLNIQPPQAPPEADAPLSIEYSYNALIERIDAQVDLIRLVGQDTLVHEADDVQLKFNLAVVLRSGFSLSDVQADIQTNLSAWVERKSFQNNIQIADVIDVVSNSVGVDNIRLVRSTEKKNDVQKLTVTPPASPDDTKDKYTITLGEDESGILTYNDSITTVRETLEAMPNIHEGNTYATTMSAAITTTSQTLVIVDDNDGIHQVTDGVVGTPLSDIWVQLRNNTDDKDEIVYVTNAVDNGATVTWTVRRAQLGTTAYASFPNTSVTDIHILGDVGVSKTGAATAGNANVYTITFLPNNFTGVNDWGYREVTLLTAAKASDNSRLTFTVAKKVNGVGDGIEVIARNDQTIVTSYDDDFYLNSDELPSLFTVDVLAKAQNTFS